MNTSASDLAARNIARVERVEAFEAESAAELAELVNAWLAGANEKVIIQRDYVAAAATDTGESEAIAAFSFACFITYTE